MELRRRWQTSALPQLAHDQDGVVSRAQLRAAGIARFAIRDEVSALRWRCIGPRVIVVHCGPLTFRQRCWVAHLHAGESSQIGGRSALRLGGMRGEPRDLVEVVVPRSTPTVPGLPGVLVRRAVMPSPPIGSPPRQRPADAAIHAARRAPTLAVSAGLLASVAQQRLATPPDLLAALERDATLRGRAVLRAVVADIEGGAQALGELGLARICRDAGLPPPSRQVVRLDGYGRRRYLDAVVVSLDLEIDGIPHLDVVQQTADCFRQNELVIGGGRVLRFTSLAMRTEGRQVGDQLVRAAMQRGATLSV